MKKKSIFIVLTLFIALICFPNNGKLSVATYNVRVDKEEDVMKGNGWKKRYAKICSLVKFHEFDIWGAQEVEQHQLKDLLSNLAEYSYIGVAREDGKEKGEFVPIFYKPDKIELLKSGNFWLSQKPDAPSKGWDAECYRIVSYGKFRVKKDGMVFWFFNTHFDHRGLVAQKRSANLVLDKIKEITDADDNIILLGDFNSAQDSNVYNVLNSSGRVVDAFNLSALGYAWHGTANNFNTDITTGCRFDHIFVSPSLKVSRYGILTDTYKDVVDTVRIKLPNFPDSIIFYKAVTRYPSDHYPVKIEVNY